MAAPRWGLPLVVMLIPDSTNTLEASCWCSCLTTIQVFVGLGKYPKSGPCSANLFHQVCSCLIVPVAAESSAYHTCLHRPFSGLIKGIVASPWPAVWLLHVLRRQNVKPYGTESEHKIANVGSTSPYLPSLGLVHRRENQWYFGWPRITRTSATASMLQPTKVSTS